MADLTVHGIDDLIVRNLKARAEERGVSPEDEHRRILEEALADSESTDSPPEKKQTLIQFLMSEEGSVLPEVELDISRSKDLEPRDLQF